MQKEVLGKCPVCENNTEVTKIYCSACDTTIEGHFQLCRFCRLSTEQKNFMDVFVKCRGNIKEIEKELGISYPTVKSRLEDLAGALGHGGQPAQQSETDRKSVLDRLNSGEISVEEALSLLKE